MRDDDSRPRRRKRNREEAKDDDPRPRRRTRHRDEDREPRPARKGRGPLIAVLAGIGLLVLVGAGVGAYFLFAGGSGKSAEDKVRPPVDLPMDMFAYVPQSPKHIRYVDIKRGEQAHDDEAQLALDGVFPVLAKLPTDMRYLCATSDSGKKVPANYLLSYGSPVDLAAVAAELKLQPLPGKLSRVYVGQIQTNAYAVFQPTPTKLFVACSLSRNQSTKPSEQLLEELLARDPSASVLSPDLIAGFQAVSGYPVITFRQEVGDQPHAHFTGSVMTSSIKDRHITREYYAIRRFGSEADAKTWMNRPQPKSDPQQSNRRETLDDYRWLRGDTLHVFGRTKTSF